MIFKKKQSVDADTFWQDYETSINEKVLAKSLAKYLSGWPEYSQPLWGLAIATSGGFRFHHFPHESWITALSRFSSGGEAPKEKTIFIPNDYINTVKLIVERRWWRKILSPSHPVLVIRCTVQQGCTIDGRDTEVLTETDLSAEAIVSALQANNPGSG